MATRGSLILRQTLDKAIDSPSEWDGGPKQVFDWSVDCGYSDGYSKVGCYGANRWYEVKTGKTEKATLSNARRKIQAIMARKELVCTFEYIED